MALAAIPFRLTGCGPNTLFRADCRKPHAIWNGRYLPGFTGFSHCSGAGARAAEFAAPAGPARLFVLPPRPGGAKNSTKSKALHLARPLRWVLADHHRIGLSASVSDIQGGLTCEPLCLAGQGQCQ